MDVKVIEELLCVLVAPGTAGLDSLDNVFANNIKNVAEKINSSETFRSIANHLSSADLLCADDSDIQYRFARLNLQLIRLLQTILDESLTHDDKEQQVAEKTPRQAPALPADSLSISQQKTITTSIGFAVCFGICPYFLAGVGVPLSRRCGFGGCVETRSSVDRDEMDRRLLASTVMLVECVNEVSSKVLGELIISRHLGDLLAALFQIRYTASRRGSMLRAVEVTNGEIEQESSSGVKSENRGLSIDEWGSRVERLPWCGVDFCRLQLDILLEKLHQPLLIQQLLILQNGPPPSPMNKLDKVNMAPVPSPVWLRKLARKCLVAAIMRPTGIQSLFAVLIQGENEKSSDWNRYDDIAKIVVDIPLGASTTMENYYEKISPQILELIRTNAHQKPAGNDARVVHRRQCVRAAVQMCALMAQRQHELVERFIMNVILRPLLQCLEKSEYPSDPVAAAASHRRVFVEESVLTSCIENIATLTTSPDDSLVTFFYPVLGVLFPLYLHVQQSVTYLRSKVDEILLWIFRHIDLPTALDFLGQCCLGMNIDPNHCLIQRMNEDLVFSSGEIGGLSIVTQHRKKSTLDISGCESLAECVVHLIVTSKRQDDIGAELFLLCLKCLSDIITNEVDSSSGKDVIMENLGIRGRGGVFRSSHLDSEAGEASAEVECIQRNLIVITLLTKMCERIGPSCMNKSTHILGFVEATLTRGVKILQNTSDSMFGAFEMETLSMALGLLTSLFADKEKLSGLDWNRMQALIPLLQTLSDSDVDPSLHEMALDLRIAIATHGLVHLGATSSSHASLSSGRKKESEKNTEQKDKGTRSNSSRVASSVTVATTTKKNPPLIEVLSSTEVSDSPDTAPFPAGKDAPTYHQVATLVCDSSVPARGYALIALRRLVEQRDAETLEHGESVLEICFLNLVHPDTYIYLAAIQVVVALAVWNSRMVVPRLTEKYAGGGGEAEKGEVEMRMKVGEVLVKVCAGLGDMVPLYRDLLLGSVLSAAKDSDALVRASAMSNLGEICRLLRFGLGNVVHEIFLCVRNLLKYDNSVEVRRGAAMFTTLLLRGLSRDMFTVLENLAVEFLRLIKDVLKNDKDNCVRLHAQASLEVLETIVRDFLTPSQTMEKHIRFP